MGIIAEWEQKIKEDRHSWERIPPEDVRAILTEAETTLTDKPSKVNKIMSKRKAHEILSAADYTKMGEIGYRLSVRNVIREFVVNRRRI